MLYQGKVEKEKQTLNDKTILFLQKMSNCEFEMNKNKQKNSHGIKICHFTHTVGLSDENPLIYIQMFLSNVYNIKKGCKIWIENTNTFVMIFLILINIIRNVDVMKMIF